MKPYYVSIIAFTLVTPSLAADDLAQRAAAARKATQSMQSQLQKELKGAMKAGGPVNAIGVCKTRAPAIAANLSKEQNMKIGRTSLKLRNPANAPDAWERTVLQLFDLRKKNGENPANIEYYETVTSNGKKEFRYMKAIAIPEKAPCLMCHGEKLDDKVAAKLKELYPKDQATGFKTGDLRGAFTVRQPLSTN